ncbi:substrate-binding periplasmic protein [Sulfidibacter corallicola]|uniref:ABC transporter substrate-binding protein n=1 Tax=Sulfidibacter corallicola TaxID=2818388 RepID=A0A8A4TJU5_SULCO|nr:ABC transporter substrate-binding protein [Sulfidibacter corallicola]QTD49820.1 ABC transporter substrate-binding protein [Sulfidibacter corallicola]
MAAEPPQPRAEIAIVVEDGVTGPHPSDVAATQQPAGTLTVMAEEFPPFSYMVGDRVVGISADIVCSILQKTNQPCSIQLVPFKRAYHNTKTKSGHVLFSVTRRKSRENDFKWVGPLISFESVVFGRVEDAEKYPDLDAMRRASSIGVLSGGSAELLLRQLEFTNLVPHPLSFNNYRKLVYGRLELTTGSEWELMFRAKMNGLDVTSIKPLVAIARNEMYIAFNKKTPQAVVESWQYALDTLKKDGTYDRIVTKYKDNPPLPPVE